MHFRLLRLLLTACAGLGIALCAPSVRVAAQPAPYEINVLLPLTGPVALLGQSEKAVFEVAEKTINAKGGIGGRPVRFAIGDDASNPQVGVQLGSALIQKKAPVILGSPFVAVCQAVAPLLAQRGPVEYCLAPIIHPAPKSYVFAAGASSFDDALVILRYLREKGLTRVAMITSNDATGQDMDEAFAAAFGLPANKAMQLVAREHFNPGEISVAAQLARIKQANPQVMIAWSIGAPMGTLFRGVRDAGIEVPVVAGNGSMLRSLMSQLKDVLPKELWFPGYRAMVENDVRPGPIHDAQTVYFNAFREAGIRPDIAAVTAWDPIMIVVDALRKIGPNATAEQLRDALLGLHGWAGINAIYDFRDGSQRGAGANALSMQRWDPAKQDWVALSRAGGATK